ncbi:MAG: efflux RND transporter periplasmic adaptor subunit, partial [Thermodesulfovibrionales bacterium]|nr:efflux RND transporter periplasmic adaptor subunit [Thermodesulfovibrionales bacterium]
FLLICILTIVFQLHGCKDKVKSGEVEVKRQAVTGVSIKEIQPSNVEDIYETTGTVKPQISNVISSKIMGVVTKINVKEGDIVKRGDVLLTIDDSDLQQRLKSAQKAFESARQNRYLAQTTYDRYKRLYDEKAISGQELDQIETQKRLAELEFERLEALYNEAKVYHGYSQITAPQDGIVSSKKIDIGSMALIGNPLIIIDSSSAYQVEIALDESLLKRIKQGMDVNIHIESINRELKAKIKEIVPAVDQTTRTFIVKVSLSGESIRSGQFVRVKIPIGTKETILVPQEAVVSKGQLVGVYAVDKDGLITYRLIKVGKKQGSMYEVLSGLQPKDRIIVQGLDKVIDGGVIKEVRSK